MFTRMFVPPEVSGQRGGAYRLHVPDPHVALIASASGVPDLGALVQAAKSSPTSFKLWSRSFSSPIRQWRGWALLITGPEETLEDGTTDQPGPDKLCASLLDIIQKQFTANRRGHEPDEVRAFLEEIRETMEDLLKENQRLREQIARFEARLQSFAARSTKSETLLPARSRKRWNEPRDARAMSSW